MGAPLDSIMLSEPKNMMLKQYHKKAGTNNTWKCDPKPLSIDTKLGETFKQMFNRKHDELL